MKTIARHKMTPSELKPPVCSLGVKVRWGCERGDTKSFYGASAESEALTFAESKDAQGFRTTLHEFPYFGA